MATPIIETKGLKKYFNVSRGLLHAVDDVDLSIAPEETLGIVGESGCGKSTLGRVILASSRRPRARYSITARAYLTRAARKSRTRIKTCR